MTRAGFPSVPALAAPGGLTPGVPLAGSPVPAFPSVPLDFKVEINLAGTWTDITGFVDMGHGSIGSTRGHPDESTQTPASQSGVTVVNTDHRFTSTNPTGPYYPNLQRNTPLRVSLAGQFSGLRMEDDTTSSASTAKPSGLLLLSQDIRIDITPSGYSPCVLASLWATSSQRAWLLALNADGTVTFYWSSDGTLGTLMQAKSTAPIPLGPICVRIDYNSGASSVTFYTAPSGSITGSAWSQLGNTVTGTGSGTNSISPTTATLAVGANPAALTDFGLPGFTGRCADFLTYSQFGGTVVAQASFASQTPGTSTWTDPYGNTWSTAGTASIDQRSYRFHGEAAGWPQKWDPTATDVTADVSVSGQIRRIAQRSKPLISPMRRALNNRGPIAYWPMEGGGAAATQFAFAGSIPGFPATILAPAKPGADNTFASSGPLPQLNGGQIFCPVPNYTDTGYDAVRFLVNFPSSLPGSGAICMIARIDSQIGGTYTSSGIGGIITGSMYLTYEPDIQALVLSGSLEASGLLSPIIVGTNIPPNTPAMVSLEFQNSGPNVIPTLRFLTTNGVVNSTTGVTITGATGRIVQVVFGQAIDPGAAGFVSAQATAVGHVFVQKTSEPLSDFAGPVAAWVGETAGNRFARVCSENAKRCRIWGYPQLSQPMGPQPIDTLANVLQQCADTDRGIMYEPSETLGLGYRTLASMLNQSPALTIGYGLLSAADAQTAMQDTEDDQQTLNDVTVTNPDGATSRQFLASGVMSVQEPPNGAGTCDQQLSVNLQPGARLVDEAGWILNVGTVDQPRYPLIKIDLADSESGIQSLWWQVLGLRLGDRFVVTSPPGMLPPGNIDQIVQGQQENIYIKVLNFGLQCVPSLPYFTGLYDDMLYGRGDTDGSVLHAGISSGALSMQVSTTGPSGLIWTTAVGDLPLQVIVGGEVMTILAISGSSSPQTFTIGFRAVNGITKAHSAGEDVRLFPTPIYSLL